MLRYQNVITLIRSDERICDDPRERRIPDSDKPNNRCRRVYRTPVAVVRIIFEKWTVCTSGSHPRITGPFLRYCTHTSPNFRFCSIYRQPSRILAIHSLVLQLALSFSISFSVYFISFTLYSFPPVNTITSPPTKLSSANRRESTSRPRRSRSLAGS